LLINTKYPDVDSLFFVPRCFLIIPLPLRADVHASHRSNFQDCTESLRFDGRMEA